MNRRIPTPLSQLLQIEVPEQKMFIDTLFPGTTLLHALPKAGKSLFAEDLAIKAIKQGHKVLYLALEYTVPMAQDRFKHAGPIKGLDLMLMGDLERWNQGGDHRLKEALGGQNYDLLVVDTLTHLKPVGDHSQYDQEAEVMAKIRRTLQKFDQLTTLLITHSSKQATPDQIITGSVGSVAITASVDTVATIIRGSGNLSKLIQVGRYGKSEIDLTYEDDEQSFKRLSPIQTLSKTAPLQAEILALFGERPEWRHKELLSRLDATGSTISDATSSLEKKGALHRKSKFDPWQLGSEYSSNNTNNPNSVRDVRVVRELNKDENNR